MLKVYYVEALNKIDRENNAKILNKKLMQKSNKVKLCLDENNSKLSYRALAFLNKKRMDYIILKLREMWRKSQSRAEFVDVCNAITKNTIINNEDYIVKYNDIKFPDVEFKEAISLFSRYEISQGNISLDKFILITKERITTYVEELSKKDNTYIFTDSFIRKIIFDIYTYFDKSVDVIAQSLDKILDGFGKVEVEILYFEDKSEVRKTRQEKIMLDIEKSVLSNIKHKVILK